MIKVTRLLAAATIFAPLVAHGQDRPGAMSAPFVAVLQAQQHRNAVLQAAQRSTTWIRHGCNSGTFQPLPTVRVWKPARFGVDGAPVEGLWGESVQASGCGIVRTLNVATVVRSPGVLVSQVLAPGATRADPQLQQDASRFVFTAGMLHAPGCRQAFIDDTLVVRQEPASSDARLIGPVEVERWAVSACGQDVTVEVEFLPLPDGTNIVAHAL